MTVWITYILYGFALILCGKYSSYDNVFLLLFLYILLELIKIRVAIGG